MLAFTSVWTGLATLVLAGAMIAHRPWMTDLMLTLVLYFGAPGTFCLGGLVLWAYRKDNAADAGVLAQRLQAKVGIFMAFLATIVGYALIILAERVTPIEGVA
jgi:hypothetical protein